ncbi:MAG TPA: complex I subunit 1 family protein [Actinomycetota bacterium]|jgi:NADH-quinone oxidoreductase subunit H|nr:complex I subunit 1 family protein [Actinomycetota bacterium]
MIDITLSAWQILLVKIAVILVVVPAGALVGGYAEHKVMAHLQHRLGPMYPGGFHGWATTLADGLKFLLKEDIIPAAADRKVFSLAPAAIFVPILMIYLVIPIDRSLIVEDLDVGIFYLLAIGSVSTIGVLMAGWSSANKYALIGALRSAAQLIAYELPIVLAAAAVAMLAGTLSLVGIVEAQDWPFALWPPGIGLLAFLIFTTGAVAEMTRIPFDMPVAESEIITGPFTEYSGMRYIFSHMFAEMGHLVAFGGIAATLFLGGYRPIVPWEPLELIPGFVWFFLKTAFMIFLFLWIRPTFPRVREDQLQKFAWMFLIPLSLVLILLVGAWVIYGP